MSATATAIDNFGKTIKQHVAKKVGDTAEIMDQIEKVKMATPPVYEESKIKSFLQQRAKALSVLIDNFLVAKLSSQFPLLDNSLFNLKRHIYILNGKVVEDRTQKVKGDGVHFEVPLFLHADVSAKRVELGKYREVQRHQYGGRYQTTIRVTATVPVVPLTEQELGRKALGFYHATVAEIYNKSTTSDLFVPEEPPTLETLWIPTVQSLSVEVDVKNIPEPRRFDPALLMKHRDRYYLIGLWDIKEELPLEGILREFTVGPVKFPKKT